MSSESITEVCQQLAFALVYVGSGMVQEAVNEAVAHICILGTASQNVRRPPCRHSNNSAPTCQLVAAPGLDTGRGGGIVCRIADSCTCNTAICVNPVKKPHPNRLMGSVGTAAAANAPPAAAPRTNRKTYTVSKAREKWTDEEHAAFLTALEKRGESSASSCYPRHVNKRKSVPRQMLRHSAWHVRVVCRQPQGAIGRPSYRT